MRAALAAAGLWVHELKDAMSCWLTRRCATSCAAAAPPSPEYDSAFAPQGTPGQPSAPPADDPMLDDLADELADELVHEYSIASGTGSLASVGGEGSAASALSVAAAAALALATSAAAATADLLLGEENNLVGAEAALASLFPEAASFSLCCPPQHGGSELTLLHRPEVAAAERCTHPAQLCSEHGGWVTLETPVPATPEERQALATYAAELERALHVAMKEQEEVRRRRMRVGDALTKGRRPPPPALHRCRSALQGRCLLPGHSLPEIPHASAPPGPSISLRRRCSLITSVPQQQQQRRRSGLAAPQAAGTACQRPAPDTALV